MNPRDLPEVIAELISESHEVRSELNALNGRVDRLERTVEEGLRFVREESRQNTDRPMEAFGKNMAPFIDRVLTHEQRITCLENSQN